MAEEAGNHTHAYEYLIELACDQSTPNWLSYIIYGMIAKHGSLSVEDLERLAIGIENEKLPRFDANLFAKIPRPGNVINSFKLRKLHWQKIWSCAFAMMLLSCMDVMDRVKVGIFAC